MKGLLESNRANGWPLVALAAVLATIAVGMPLLLNADPVEGIRQAIRATARLSLVLFLLAFTASALRHFRPGALADWQVRNRRFFGLGLGVSHLAHLGAIIAFVQMAPALFWGDRTPLGNLPGAIGYAVLTLMLLTSFPGPAARLGARGWKRLHGVGVWVLWLLFVGGLRSHDTGGTDYALLIALAVAGAGLRVAHTISRARGQRPGPSRGPGPAA